MDFGHVGVIEIPEIMDFGWSDMSNSWFGTLKSSILGPLKHRNIGPPPRVVSITGMSWDSTGIPLDARVICTLMVTYLTDLQIVLVGDWDLQNHRFWGTHPRHHMRSEIYYSGSSSRVGSMTQNDTF